MIVYSMKTVIFFVLIMVAPAISKDIEPNSLSQKKEMNNNITKKELTLVFAVVKDCLTLLPDELSNKLSEPNINVILQGAQDFNNPSSPIKYSTDQKNLGWQAALVIRKIYNRRLPAEMNIPASIYYEKYNESNDPNKTKDSNTPNKPNVLQRLDTIHSQLTQWTKKDKEYYNAAVNMLLDLWIEDLRKSGYELNSPDEGIYLRDDEDSLYLYEKA
jgi:hypothetical protein